MRVHSGFLRNRLLKSPETSLIRPTADKIKGAVFSSLSDDIEGARFLDVFSGTGSIGIEAYSRGASFVTFIDKDTEYIEYNVKKLNLHKYKVIKSDFFRVKLSAKFDIVYIDPPYGVYTKSEVLNKLYKMDLLNKEGIVVYEDSKRTPDEDNIFFKVYKQKQYGETLITYYKLIQE